MESACLCLLHVVAASATNDTTASHTYHPFVSLRSAVAFADRDSRSGFTATGSRTPCAMDWDHPRSMQLLGCLASKWSNYWS